MSQEHKLNNALVELKKLMHAEKQLKEQIKKLGLEQVRTFLKENLPLNKPMQIEDNPPKYVYAYMNNKTPPANLDFVMNCIFRFLTEYKKVSVDDAKGTVEQYLNFVQSQQEQVAKQNVKKYYVRDLRITR